MPKIGQASGPKYIPADVGMVEIDAKKMPKIGQALVSKYLPAHVNINDIKHNELYRNVRTIVLNVILGSEWLISRWKKSAEGHTSIAAKICIGACQ